MSEILQKIRSHTVENKVTGCWEWQGAKNNKGYGNIGIDGKNYVVSRLVFMLFYAIKLPRRVYVCHHCDNPICCHPEHLFKGTQLDNIRDCMRKGRKPAPFHASGCDNPRSLFSREQIQFIATSLLTRAELARKLRVSWQAIDRIKRGITYADIDSVRILTGKEKTIITTDQRDRILSCISDFKTLAASLGISTSAIFNIRARARIQNDPRLYAAVKPGRKREGYRDQ